MEWAELARWLRARCEIMKAMQLHHCAIAKPRHPRAFLLPCMQAIPLQRRLYGTQFIETYLVTLKLDPSAIAPHS